MAKVNNKSQTAKENHKKKFISEDEDSYLNHFTYKIFPRFHLVVLVFLFTFALRINKIQEINH